MSSSLAEGATVSIKLLANAIASREPLLAETLQSGAVLAFGRGDDALPRQRPPRGWRQLASWAALSALATFVLAGTLVLCVALNIVGWTRLWNALLCLQNGDRRRRKSLRELNEELNRRTSSLSPPHAAANEQTIALKQLAAV